MSIKTAYNLKGIEIKDAIIRIERLWGSSRDGWTALVSVNVVTDVPAAEPVGVEGDEDYVPAQEQRTELTKITEFNHSASFINEERGYVSMYKALHDAYGGYEV